MDKLTRRGFFKQASVSAVTTGMLAATPAFISVAETPEAPAAAEISATTVVPETLVAHVRDFASGEVGLMVGTQEIIYRDTELVARLLRAVH